MGGRYIVTSANKCFNTIPVANEFLACFTPHISYPVYSTSNAITYLAGCAAFWGCT